MDFMPSDVGHSDRLWHFPNVKTGLEWDENEFTRGNKNREGSKREKEIMLGGKWKPKWEEIGYQMVSTRLLRQEGWKLVNKTV